MADITFATNPTDGALVDPAQLNDNTYKPATPTASFAELNGLVSKANMDTLAWKLRSGLIRNRSCGGGKMVGSTMNLDYLSVLNPDDGDTEGAYIPVPGCSLNFYLPRDPTVCWLTWQLTSAVDMGDLVNEPVTKFRLYVDGARVSEHSRQQPPAVYASGRHVFTDRIWSGSHMYPASAPMTQGWHNATIMYWAGSYEIRNAAEVAAGNTDEDFGGMCRFRVKNMKMFWLR